MTARPAATGPVTTGERAVRPPARWGRLDADTRLVWALAWLSLAGATLLAVLMAVTRRQVDIDVYLMGGAHLVGPHLYDAKLPESGLYFTYAPFAALPFLPLALLPARLTQAIWAVVNVAALMGLTAVSIRAVRPGTSRRRIVQLSMLLSLPFVLLNPLFVHIQLGQVNLVLTLMVLADLTGVRRIGRVRLPEGVLTGIAAAVKLTPLVFLPYLLLIGRRRAALWLGGTFLACEALAAAVSPASSWNYWSKLVFDPRRAGNLTYISDQNLRSVIERLFHTASAPAALVWPLTIGVAAGGLLLAALAHRRSSPMLGILVCATTGLVVSPITWVHHLVWVVPALIWLVAAEDRPARGRVWAAGAAILFWAAPVWWVPNNDLRELNENAWQFVAGNSFFLAMLVFLAGTALLMARRLPGKRANTPSVP